MFLYVIYIITYLKPNIQILDIIYKNIIFYLRSHNSKTILIGSNRYDLNQ